MKCGWRTADRKNLQEAVIIYKHDNNEAQRVWALVITEE